MAMKYFSPQFKIATLAPKQKRLRSKIGGVPWGLPAKRWPKCCGFPQKLLAQLCHKPPMLDLGTTGTVLYLFQCLECLGIDGLGSGKSDSGGRAAFILHRSEMGSGFTTVDGFDHSPEMGERLIGEAFIEGYQNADDGIPESRLPEFYKEESVWALHEEFSQINWFGEGMTKFGGSPRWTGNGPMSCPRKPYEFLFQLNSSLRVNGHPPTPDEAGCKVGTHSVRKNGETIRSQTLTPRPENVRMNAPWGISFERTANHYEFEFTNLGTDGRVYVFINRARTPHAVTWFWNR